MVPADSVILTRARLDANKAYREKQEFLARQKQERTEQQRLLGAYIFTAADKETFCDLPADMLARAVYLAAHLDFDSNTLWATQRRPLKRSELPTIMNLSKPAADVFWRSVKDRYFYTDENGILHTKGSAFIMGHLDESPSTEYQKTYVEALKELYKKISPRQHKRLGCAFQMIPYLNFEFNILCHNPATTVYSEIVPLTVAEFCEAIGFDKTHASQLASDYGRLTFTVDGSQEVFCEFMSNGRDITTANIFINPRLVYKGSDFRKVAAIGISFAADAKPA